MKKVIFLILIGMTLSGCFFRPHKMDIQQGNVFTEETASRLHTGMSEGQVRAIMGTPVTVNVFSTSRLDYIYTNQPGHGDLYIKRVVCTFRNGRLENVQRTQATVREPSGFFGLW